MITVIGSINMDLVTSTARFPKQGETVQGTGFAEMPGGKGANQAVAAAKLSANVQFVGAVGTDAFGQTLIDNLQQYNINCSAIVKVEGPTGIANIILHDEDNRIIVIAGANEHVSTDIVDAQWEQIAASKLVVLQLEIPAETVQHILQRCHAEQIPVLLNPAPAASFKVEWMPYVTYLTPNDSECQDIFGKAYESVIAQYPNKVIVTLGSKGVCYHDGEQIVQVATKKVQVVDTTGAGDTFNGAFAYAITKGDPLQSAVAFASKAATLSVQQFGAQGGMPTLQQMNND